MISKATLFYFGVVLAFGAIYVGGQGGSKAVPIVGLYNQQTNYSDENMADFMEAMGFDEFAKVLIAEDKRLMIQISKVDAKTWKLKKITKKKSWDMVFQSGVEFEATLLDGRKIKSTITVNQNPNKPTIHRVFKMEGFDATSDYKICEKGFNLTFKAREAKVELRYDRVHQSDINLW